MAALSRKTVDGVAGSVVLAGLLIGTALNNAWALLWCSLVAMVVGIALYSRVDRPRVPVLLFSMGAAVIVAAMVVVWMMHRH
ncbi:MAG TPA: hypothetical protein PLS53_16555 [Thermoanaerobaculaceae bacterium]|nr:hypothetical protein [Thermoanaerobaculaceae bacterium]HPS79772.1 hypothetical protein [Thermoanaerobaculaceae bacterium]